MNAAPGEVMISLVGDLDLAVEDDVVATLLRAAETPNIAAMRVDLTQVSFIDSSGVRSCWPACRPQWTVASPSRLTSRRMVALRNS